MKNWLLPAAVVGLAVALAYLAWVNLSPPHPPASSETPVVVAPQATPPAPAALPAVVDVLDIDPLLDPPAGASSDPIPTSPVVTAFGDDPIPEPYRPYRPASAVAPIPRAVESVNVEVAPMPREVNAETSLPPVFMGGPRVFITNAFYRRW
jgi:hypothetical protein